MSELFIQIERLEQNTDYLCELCTENTTAWIRIIIFGKTYNYLFLCHEHTTIFSDQLLEELNKDE